MTMAKDLERTSRYELTERALAASERELSAVCSSLCTTSTNVISASLGVARAARSVRPSTATKLKVVRPGEPLPQGDLTGKFAAYGGK
jgi:hypothetical protein